MTHTVLGSTRRLPGLVLVVLAACGGGSSEDPAANLPPTVTLLAPATGATGAAMTLTAVATDGDTIARVEFFDGGNAIGEDTTSPYSLSWVPATEGEHLLTARAVDARGAATTSSAVAVAVHAPIGGDAIAPTATLTAPVDFAAGLAGMLVVSATAADNVAVTSVEFEIDGMPVGVADTEAPYDVAVDTSRFTSGQHVLRARASDAAGNVSAWSSVLVQFGGNVKAPSGFTLDEAWITGIANATAFAQAGDGRIFVAEQTGAIRVIKNGALLPTPFATVSVDFSGAGERGLIGIALHPDFASNGWLYIHATRVEGGAHNRISRLTATGDVAAAGSEVALVDLPTLSSDIHNGGALHFGGDGKLYVGVGDDGDAGQASRVNTPFGKLLRFNDDGTIPGDNPFFASQSGLARAIWAYGLRNPFTFAIQPGTGRIHINDVGQDTWEEINLGIVGAHYGWPVSEGPTSVAGITEPLFAYRHEATSPPGTGPGGFFTGRAIAGGAFYPAAGAFPAGYRDQYYFADFLGKFVGRLDPDPRNGNAAYAFARLSGLPVDVLAGVDGALYVLTRSGITRISAS